MELPLIVAVAGLTGFTAQILKFAVKKLSKTRNKDVHNMWSYSGIPSSHTALVTGLATAVAFADGLNSSSFAIAFILGLLIIRDALGLRNYVNKSLQDIHHLVTFLPEGQQKEFEQLHIRVGHTRVEVFAGAIAGVVLGTAYYFLFVTLFR
jgi:acid phosphatase family membrane protein YuiD